MDDVGSSQWWRRLHECVQALLRFLHDTMGYQMTIKRQSLHIDSGYAPCLSRCVHVLVMTSRSIARCIMGTGNCDESTWKVITIGFIHGDVHEQSSKKLFYILSYLLWSHYPNQWPPSPLPLTDIYMRLYSSMVDKNQYQLQDDRDIFCYTWYTCIISNATATNKWDSLTEEPLGSAEWHWDVLERAKSRCQ